MSADLELDKIFSGTISRDLRDMILGDWIASGSHRGVFQHATDKTCIIKLEKEYHQFYNVIEWEVWNRVKDTEYAKWFAPCVAISNNGRFLIQKKTKKVEMKKLPRKILHFFCDRKVENWGLYRGQPVCHDYALTVLMEEGMSKKMEIVKWL